MTKNADGFQEELFARIVSAIRQSGLLTEKELDYIDSALFPPEPEPLIDFITDGTDCERDTLLDLIFSPDPAVQMDVEPLLEKFAFSSENENSLTERLIATEVFAPIRMPDDRELASISVPDDIKSQYLTRMNITWQLDLRVRSAIEQSVAPPLRSMVKVKLRNTNSRPLPHHLTFLCQFFERLEDNDPSYLTCLDLTLSLLQTTDQDKDVYELLAEHKRSLFRNLQQVKRFETLLKRSNMETLMLQGVRAPHASRQQLLYQMELIDRICFAVFGKIEIIAEPVEEHLRQISDPTDTEAAVRTILR